MTASKANVDLGSANKAQTHLRTCYWQWNHTILLHFTRSKDWAPGPGTILISSIDGGAYIIQDGLCPWGSTLDSKATNTSYSLWQAEAWTNIAFICCLHSFVPCKNKRSSLSKGIERRNLLWFFALKFLTSFLLFPFSFLSLLLCPKRLPLKWPYWGCTLLRLLPIVTLPQVQPASAAPSITCVPTSPWASWVTLPTWLFPQDSTFSCGPYFCDCFPYSGHQGSQHNIIFSIISLLVTTLWLLSSMVLPSLGPECPLFSGPSITPTTTALRAPHLGQLTGTPQRHCGFSSRPRQRSKYCNTAS